MTCLRQPCCSPLRRRKRLPLYRVVRIHDSVGWKSGRGFSKEAYRGDICLYQCLLFVSWEHFAEEWANWPLTLSDRANSCLCISKCISPRLSSHTQVLVAAPLRPNASWRLGGRGAEVNVCDVAIQSQSARAGSAGDWAHTSSVCTGARKRDSERRAGCSVGNKWQCGSLGACPVELSTVHLQVHAKPARGWTPAE